MANLPKHEDQGDSTSKGRNHESLREGQSGRFDSGLPGKKLPQIAIQGHSSQATEGTESLQEGNVGRFQKVLSATNLSTFYSQGDSDQKSLLEVQEDDFATYNVTYIINTITSNVQRKRIAQFLGKVLEEDVTVFAKYLKLFNEFPPEIIGRAYLSTMVLVHHAHWSIDRPGAFFTSQCRALSGQTALRKYTLEDVEEWNQKWGNLPYTAFLQALLTPSPISSPASLRTPPHSGVPLTKGSTAKPGFSNNGAGSHFKRRTYGMHYTGLPSGRYPSGNPRPPQQ